MWILMVIISYYELACVFNSLLPFFFFWLFASDNSFLKEAKYHMQSTSCLHPKNNLVHSLAMHKTEPNGTI